MSDEVVAAWRGLRAAAASADGIDDVDRRRLADAVHVHAGQLDGAELLRLVHHLTVTHAMACQSIDKLTGALERAAGGSSWPRIDAALGRQEP